MRLHRLSIGVFVGGLLGGAGPAPMTGAPTSSPKAMRSLSHDSQFVDLDRSSEANGIWTIGTQPFEKRLVRTSEDAAPEWLTEDDIDELRRRRMHFVDVTEWEGPLVQPVDYAAPQPLTSIPNEPTQQDKVWPLLDQISPPNMRNFLQEYTTTFRTRYYKSNSGVEACEWLHNQILGIVEEGERTLAVPSNITVSLFGHRFPQSSIIARFEPDRDAGGENDEIVIVGAHLDSVNQWIPSFGRSPGADDDGSGTATTLEAFRVLVKSGFQPSRPVEFHWYAAEEAGLLGSADVARAYARANRKVVSMMQFDMTGYIKPRTQERVGIIDDRVDPDLTAFLRRLVEEYSGLEWVDTSCGYGCSDHYSWTKAGYRSAFPFEGEFKDSSPYVHSTEDTIETLNFEHMAAFARLAISYAVELGSAAEEEEVLTP